MKRSAGDKPMDVIEISDDDSPSKQPPQKTMKKDVEKSTSQTFLGVHQSLVKLENDYKDACRVSAEAQKRVALLENLLEKRRDVIEDVEKEELKKRLTVVYAKLEEAERKNEELIKRDCEKAQEIAELKKTIASMHTDQQLLHRISELNRQLTQLEEETQEKLQIQMQSQNKLIEDQQKKIAETSAELEKEKCKATIREEQLNRLAKLEKDFQGVCRIANEYEMGMNDAKARVLVLENIIDTKPIIAPVVPNNAEKNLVAELRTKLVETSTQLENERSEGAMREKRLQDCVHSLTQQLEAEKSRGRDRNSGEIRIDQNRINKDAGSPPVPGKVDAIWSPLAQSLVLPTKTPETTAARPNSSLIGSGPSLLRVPVQPPARPRHLLLKTPLVKATSPNLYSWCNWKETPGSIAFDRAFDQLLSRYHPSDKMWQRQCKKVLRSETHSCTACNKFTLANTNILGHFFSMGHISKMRTRNAGVPRVTFEYWMEKLDSIAKPVVDPAPIPKATVIPKVYGAVGSAKPVTVPATTLKATVAPKVGGAVKTQLIPKTTPAPAIAVPNAAANALKRFLSRVTATTTATAAAVTPKEPIPKFVTRTITAVVYPTVAEGAPATKVQVATVAPTVTASITPMVEGNPFMEEETDLEETDRWVEGL